MRTFFTLCSWLLRAVTEDTEHILGEIRDSRELERYRNWLRGPALALFLGFPILVILISWVILKGGLGLVGVANWLLLFTMLWAGIASVLLWLGLTPVTAVIAAIFEDGGPVDRTRGALGGAERWVRGYAWALPAVGLMALYFMVVPFSGFALATVPIVIGSAVLLAALFAACKNWKWARYSAIALMVGLTLLFLLPGNLRDSFKGASERLTESSSEQIDCIGAGCSRVVRAEERDGSQVNLVRTVKSCSGPDREIFLNEPIATEASRNLRLSQNGDEAKQTFSGTTEENVEVKVMGRKWESWDEFLARNNRGVYNVRVRLISPAPGARIRSTICEYVQVGGG